MNRALFIVSLVLITLACAILSVIYYPSQVERYIDNNNMSNEQFLLLIKNIAYDINGLQPFYSWPLNDSEFVLRTSFDDILPTFFAISAPCSSANNDIERLNCYEYNLNNVTIENKGAIGVAGCSSMDNTVQAKDALAHTVRIRNDVYLFHKNCVIAKNVDLTTNPTSLEIPVSDVTTLKNAAMEQNAIVNALKSVENGPKNTDNSKYKHDIYTVTIDDAKVANLIVLARPVFLRFGMSCLYRIRYRDNATDSTNSVNKYSSNINSGKLTLQVRKVQENKIYPTNLINLKEAYDLVKNNKSLDVDCKPKNILDPGGTFLSSRYNAAPISVTTSSTDTNVTMNLMLYYLTHSQVVSATNANTRCVSLFFKDVKFTATETNLFEFATHRVVAQVASSNKKITLKNFGRTLELDISIPDENTSDVSVIVTWSENRLTLLMIYSGGDDKRKVLLKSEPTSTKCNLLKTHFDKACEDQNCKVGAKSNSCLITLYDFAKSNGLL